MSDINTFNWNNQPIKIYKKNEKYILHILLFIATFFTTAIAGVQWANKDFTDLLNWHYGITYAVLILTFLSAHEFGHYFAAKFHKVDTTLPYYIPMPIPYLNFFGTFGAVIKTRSPFNSKKALFDIGVAGPLAGFVVCFIFLLYGLMTLPPIDYLYNIHPEYLSKYHGVISTKGLHFGDTILYQLMANLFANPKGFLPPMNELYHYPFLNVGWFGMFVTSLNMLPIGQLDGGHVTYAMFGKRIQGLIARIFWWMMIILGLGTVLSLLYQQLQINEPGQVYIIIQSALLPFLDFIKHNFNWYFMGWGGWLFWAFITRIFIKIDHPPIAEEGELDDKRKFLGWVALVILVVCFAYNGIYILE